jgi:MoaA/NifB/PqqE/SkfB family radical SAM enzyme
MDGSLSPVAKKARLLRAWTSNHPIWTAWQVTYRCNFRCRMCHYWCDPMGLAPEPDVSAYVEGSRKLASFGSLMVSLAGGEPLLREDLPEIIRAVGRFHFPFVTTNGWFVTERSASAIMDAGAWGVSVSIDYDQPARHDARRGMPGAWKQAWRAVELLSAARVSTFQRVNVMCVLMDDNLDQLEGILARAADCGAYVMVQPYGQWKTGSTAYAHNNGPVGPRLVALRQRWPNFLSNPTYLKRFDDYLHDGVLGCRAGQAFFNIDSTGDVAICVEKRNEPVANLYRDPPSRIHRRLQSAAHCNPCRGCWYNCRGEVESLYRPWSLLQSLPTYLMDRGRAPRPVPAAAGGNA